MNKTVSIVSGESEFYNALQRALKSVRWYVIGAYREDIYDKKKKTILLYCEENELRELIYEKIRLKYLHPIVVIGHWKREFFESFHPLFCDHPYNHGYIEVPFELSELSAVLSKMKPISSQAIRKAICGADKGYKGYLWKRLDHDLLKDKDQCIRILRAVENFLDDKRITKKIDIAIKGISEKNSEWSLMAGDIAEELKGLLRKEGK